MSGPHTPRWLDLDGAHNVRDVGGLAAGPRRVRAGVLLRGDHLEDLTDAGVQRLFQEVGLRAVVDLRAPSEDPVAVPWMASRGVQRLHLPLVDLTRIIRGRYATDPGGVYADMLTEAAPALVQILRFLVAEHRVPALVHCAAGKDRTGITVAVLLAAAGVDDADIIADYTATGLRLERINASLARRGGYPVSDLPPRPAPLPDTPIRAVLAALHATDGGAEQFLTHHGATPADLDRWRTLLLEDTP